MANTGVSEASEMFSENTYVSGAQIQHHTWCHWQCQLKSHLLAASPHISSYFIIQPWNILPNMIYDLHGHQVLLTWHKGRRRTYPSTFQAQSCLQSALPLKPEECHLSHPAQLIWDNLGGSYCAKSWFLVHSEELESHNCSFFKLSQVWIKSK